MINFCMKSVNSLLGFDSSKDSGTVLETPRYSRNIPSPVCGLHFVASSGGQANVVESSSVRSPISSPSSTTSAVKKDSGGIGFLDEVGGSVDGLMSCTETLGFESSNERRVDDQIEFTSRTTPPAVLRSKWKRTAGKVEEKKFPPPLSSLNQNGKPIFFLRPVRKDGRLELKEVKIDRIEVLRASRQDGRLRLHLIKDDDELEDEVEVEDGEEKIEESIEEEEEEEVAETVDEEEKLGKEEEKIDGNWLFPVGNNSGGDGFRRCHELMSHHHYQGSHHHLHGWSQSCVTIR